MGKGEHTVQPIKSVDDIKRMSKYLQKKNGIMYSTVFKVGLYSGLRISDILGLDVEDVENKSNIVVKEKKTGKIKRFPIKDKLKEVLNEYLEYRKDKYVLSEVSGNPLFVGRQHKRLDRSQVHRALKEAAKVLNIEGNFSTHSMRKTFGYHHYQQFHDVVLLQKIFNHSSAAITLRYIGIEQEEINQSYECFDYSAKPKKKPTQNTDFSELEKRLDSLERKLNKVAKNTDILVRLFLSTEQE